MRLAPLLTTKRIATVLAILIGALAMIVVYSRMTRPARTPMERYIPVDALAFIEVDSLTDVIDGLTDTIAWRELSPLLGVSSQWRQIGSAAALIGETGIGPDEAVLVGRAQCALVVTGIDAETADSDEGPYVHLRPRLALIIETHLSEQRAAKLVSERASIVAAKIFGDELTQATRAYEGSRMSLFSGADPGKIFGATAIGSVIVLSNGEEPLRKCLDSIAGRAGSLTSDATLQSARHTISDGSAAFAFVTQAGLQKLVSLGPAILGSSASSETASAAVTLLEHLSEEAADGVSYSAEFVDGAVRERYLWSLRQPLAEGLGEAVRPPADRDVEFLKLIPNNIDEVTIVRAENEGELPERLLKQLTSRVDVVLAVALRELIISVKKEYGLQPSESLGNSIGSEAVLVNFGDGEPNAILFRVNDRSMLMKPIAAYLSQGGARVTTSEEGGVQVSAADDDDRRAAAFVGDYLVLGTREQLSKAIAASAGASALSNERKVAEALSSAPGDATLISYRLAAGGAAEFMLAISKALRVTDGSREILQRQPVREAVDRLPRTRSFTVIKNDGIFTETRSAVGNLRRVASLAGD
jgi:hypothetical protein